MSTIEIHNTANEFVTEIASPSKYSELVTKMLADGSISSPDDIHMDQVTLNAHVKKLVSEAIDDALAEYGLSQRELLVLAGNGAYVALHGMFTLVQAINNGSDTQLQTDIAWLTPHANTFIAQQDGTDLVSILGHEDMLNKVVASSKLIGTVIAQIYAEAGIT